MNRSKGDMASPRYLLVVLAILNYIALTCGGPLGPLPNITSADLGLKEGSCALGDVVYMSGDEFPGSGPCERCTCGAGGVHCAQQTCEPRPGCKALHRPDHCCPTYQCECEQEGRVYGNGEKLVDPKDPCRVCYCQGGEVVCRRIACFVRDDCTPRLVPGRCCPEYENCPLRGVTSLPGITLPPGSFVEKVEVVPTPPKEIKQEITIKEITPVSEIPVITDVKIKEILPSPSIEVAEYSSSSKSPLITREATSEKNVNAEPPKAEAEVPSVIEIHSSPETTFQEVIKTKDDTKRVDDAPPSKISLSTQDSINSDIYPSNVPVLATLTVPAVLPNSPVPVATTTKPHMMEEDDPSLFVDHNPAFPPLPDDLSVLINHGDELVPEPSADTDHISIDHAHISDTLVPSVPASTEVATESKEVLTTTLKYLPDSSVNTTEKSLESFMETSTIKLEIPSTSDVPVVKENPMINLRSAIPTELASAHSAEITAGDHEISSTTVTANEASSTFRSTTTLAPIIISTTTIAYEPSSAIFSTTTSANEPTFITTTDLAVSKSIEDMSIEDPAKSTIIEITTTGAPKISKKLEGSSTEQVDVPKASEEISTEEPESPIDRVRFFDTSTSSNIYSTTYKPTEQSTTETISTTQQVMTTNSIQKSNAATEVTSQTELSSLPIETSDQNPHEASDNVLKDTLDVSTVDPLTPINKILPSNSEVIAVSKSYKNGTIDNVETTEFIVNFGSSESATDAVEVIKITGDSEKNAAIIDNTGNKNALTNLIELVSDVALIGDHTQQPVNSDSDELIPVNAGYKSKNSNFNKNSITELPSFKSKSGPATNKQKIVEIEDYDESGSITDSPVPNDKVEPTTRRPIIDNVSDDNPVTKTDKKDIEIIQSYVPTINRRPTKVVLEEVKSTELLQDDAPVATTGPLSVEGSGSQETATSASDEVATAEIGKSVESIYAATTTDHPDTTLSPSQ